MKKIAFLAFLLVCTILNAQQVPPAKINYQGVARNLNGQPITGVLGIEVLIRSGSAAGTVVYRETHSVLTNQFGIYNIVIGSVNTNSFATIQWGTGPHFLQVGIDPTGGINYSTASVQELVSVPYALYAKDAANVKEYVAGNNISIASPSAGNTYTINSTGGSGSNATITIVPNSHQVNSTGNIHQLSIASPSFVSNSDAITMSGTFPSYTMNYQNPSLSVTGGSVLTITQGTYTSPAVTLNNVGSGPWSSSLTNVYLTAGFNNVGIGTNSPAARLDVISLTSNVINATSTGYGNALNAITTGTGLGVYSSASTGAAVLGVNSSAIGAAVQANNSGVAESFYAYKSTGQTGTVAKFENFNPSNTATAVVINTSGNSTGLSVNSGNSNAILANSNGGTPSIYATNSGAGSAIEAQNLSSGASLYAYKASANGSAAMFNNASNGNNSPVLNVNNSNATGGIAVNVTHTAGIGVNVTTNGPGNVINATTNGGGIGVNVSAGGNNAVRAVNSSSTSPAVYASNSGLGTGLQGITASTSNFAYGVQGTNSGLGSGVYGEASGTGAGFAAGVYGYSSGDFPAMLARNVSGGNVTTASGIRAITNASNTNAAGVHGENTGLGPAVKASLTTFTVAGSLNAALLLENGHIKAMGNTPTMSTYTFGGFAVGAVGLGGSLFSANDVKGTVSFYTPIGFTGVTAGAFVEQTIAFSKQYSIPPTVVVTPLVDVLGFDYLVKNISTAGFTIRIYRSTNSAVPTTATQNYEFRFNYIVIE